MGLKFGVLFRQIKLKRVHLQFCKSLLGVKKCTQNDVVYGELGRTTLINRRYIHIIKCWLKIIETDEYNIQNEYII